MLTTRVVDEGTVFVGGLGRVPTQRRVSGSSGLSARVGEGVRIALDSMALKVAMIGTGRIAEMRLLPALSNTDEAVLWSVLSRDKARAAAVAEQFGAQSSNAAHDNIDEMLADPELPEQARADCQVLQQQIRECRNTLNELSRTAEVNNADPSSPAPLADFVTCTVERWAVRRPGIRYHVHCPTQGSTPTLMQDTTLAQAFENLLNNAADAGSDKVEVTCDWDQREARISVRDWGSGIQPELLADIGKPIIRASRSGLGIGLLLSHATVERYGGRIELQNADDGGAIATLTLPLEQPADA